MFRRLRKLRRLVLDVVSFVRDEYVRGQRYGYEPAVPIEIGDEAKSMMVQEKPPTPARAPDAPLRGSVAERLARARQRGV